MALGPYLKSTGDGYECLLCDRYFKNKKALYDHCRNTARHEWCERCRRVFKKRGAKTAHIRYSSSHNPCFECPRGDRGDFGSVGELKDHYEEAHSYCRPCERFFGNDNNLRMHNQTHHPRNLECYGCEQTFKSFSGMLIHLEFGNCSSGTDKSRIYKLAHQCYQRKKYTTGDDLHPYKCPGCDSWYSRLSGLYQHAEDVPGCSEWLEAPKCLAKLRHFIWLMI
ncbi:hypothetical protein ASPWEDRAFT_170774 [Aspergillus wentii DTO 134E9]|uniref:C2H2-type domain-containing protein n=1 Tax=Aspergillus wentii DTO 134E9 TaxID=1073089 RepID=A0A1L9RQS4_ASPWE|nr:uncharacterized protein ASPWEDRAFT_170774 [Aspergillus wentii DTO 134E9]KAI9928228.1 hypothetical protein MW887_002261 [Aspergillus wentii]OJJ37289.1 hypothetical protein ASPWEDRAFT_170774 [Aspergillus wentii DTO 134E9]